jgi:RNA polymerase sigma-70 factor, ECF subfamily
MDDELVRRARHGDREAAGRLYERHAPRVYAIVRRLAGEDELAADWAHETWMAIFRGLPGFRGEARFTTWLHRVAVNTALQGQRSIARQRGRLEAATRERAGQALASTEVPDRPLLRLSLERAIDALPPRMRRVLVLHDVEGYTHEEIGDLLGVSVGTCKSQLFKARAKLRERLEPGGAPEDCLEEERICVT